MGELASGAIGALIGGVLALLGGALEARRERHLRAREDKVVAYLDYLRWRDEVKDVATEVQWIPSELAVRLSAYGSADVKMALTTEMYLDLLGKVARKSKNPDRRTAWAEQVSLLHWVLSAVVSTEIRDLRPRAQSPRARYIHWRAERRIRRAILNGEEIDLDWRKRIREIRETADRAVRGNDD